MKKQFEIPVVLLIFKRLDTTLRIIDVIRKIEPSKVYIVSDAGRNVEEQNLVREVRECIEKAIDWNCEVIKDYAIENRGVYGNIGKGAIRVFEKEKYALFLEDDNLPEASFFYFCEDMLEKYENDEKVLWICGTNYLGEYNDGSENNYSFTKEMLPCGWASWAHKFQKYYDLDFSLLEKYSKKELKHTFKNKKLFNHYFELWQDEKTRLLTGKKPISWDYQMALTIRANNLVGIVPHKNQIKNIGVDMHSIHGGTSMDNEMTVRLCGMESYEIENLKFEKKDVTINCDLDRKLEKIILPPFKLRFKTKIVRNLRKMLKLDVDQSIKSIFKK